MTECIFCEKSQTHRVCSDCFEAMREAEKWCPICGEPADEPVHDWDCFK